MRPQNRLAFLAVAEAFLAEHLGAATNRSEPISPAQPSNIETGARPSDVVSPRRWPCRQARKAPASTPADRWGSFGTTAEVYPGFRQTASRAPAARLPFDTGHQSKNTSARQRSVIDVVGQGDLLRRQSHTVRPPACASFVVCWSTWKPKRAMSASYSAGDKLAWKASDLRCCGCSQPELAQGRSAGRRPAGSADWGEPAAACGREMFDIRPVCERHARAPSTVWIGVLDSRQRPHWWRLGGDKLPYQQNVAPAI